MGEEKAMTAAIVLLQTQVRILIWPILAVLAGLVVLQVSSTRDLFFLPFFTGLGLINVVAVIVAGPLVFGTEFAEGALGFLRTRPGSPRLVFNCKIGLLFLLAALATIVIGHVLPPDSPANLLPYHIPLELTIWAILLNASLCCAGVTILCRDGIRGLLYGIPVFLGLLTLAWLIRWPHVLSNVTVLDAIHPSEAYHFGPHPYPSKDLLAAGATILSPFPVASLLASIHRSTSLGRFTISPAVYPIFVVFLLYIGVCTVSVSDEGKTYYQGFEGKNWAMRSENGDVFLVHSPRSHPSQTRKVEWRQGEVELVPHRRIDLMTPIPRELGSYAVIHYDREHLVIKAWARQVGSQTGSNNLEVFNVGESGAFESIAKIEGQSGYVGRVHKIDSSHLAIYRTFRKDDGTVDQSSWVSLNLTTGCLDPIEPDAIPSDPWHEVTVGNRRYRLDRKLDTIQIEWISETDDNNLKTQMPRLPVMVAAQNILVGIEPAEIGQNSVPEDWAPDRFTPVLYDLTDPGKITKIALDTPRKVLFSTLVDHSLPERWRDLLYKNFSNLVPFIRLTLSDGYLVVWYEILGRAAVWDVNDAQNPLLVGTAPIPGNSFLTLPSEVIENDAMIVSGPATMLRRSDGAIGFFLLDGAFVWFEFPALMKENKS